MFQKKTICCGIVALLTVCLAASALLRFRTADSPYALAASAANLLTEGDLKYSLEGNLKATVVACDESATSIVIPEKIQGYVVVGIANDAFLDCDKLTTVTIPGSVVSIGDSAFYGCSSLTSVVIPDAVTSIPDYCFAYCTALQNMTLGKQTTTIGDEAFAYCQNLATIKLPERVAMIGIGAFASCVRITSVVIPDRVTSIPNFCFSGCTALQNVTLSKQTTVIGASAFWKCEKITSVVIPDAVTSIPDYCFAYCTALQSVKLGKQTTTIGGVAFAYCPNLAAIEFPERVTTIGDGAFTGCERIPSVVVPDTVTSIPDFCFYGCTALQSVTLGKQTTAIGDQAFYGCKNLAAIELPESVTTIDSYAFGMSGLTAMDIPDSANSLGEGLFYGSANLQTVTLPYAIQIIPNWMFMDCTALHSVHIPFATTTIGEASFSGCPALQTIQYSGTQTAFNAIEIGTNNSYFQSAKNKHFLAGYVIASPQDCTVEENQKAQFLLVTAGTIDTYQWQFSGDNGTSWTNIPNAPTDATQITIPATAKNNGYLYRCKTIDCHDFVRYSKPARLTVQRKLAITQQTETVYVDRDATATFSVGAYGDGLVYQWQYTKNNGASWGNLTGETTATYSVKAVAARNGFAYRCRVTDQYGNKVFSQKAKLILKTEAAITQQPSPVTAFRDTTAQFSVKAVGDGLVYQWQYTKNNGASWGNLTGETTAAYSVKAVAARNGFAYRCRVTDQYGNKVFSKKVKLTVVSATTILTQPEAVLASVGTTATFSVEAVGKGLTYQWQYTKNNGASWGNLTGETSTSYSVKAVAARNGFCYRVRIMDADGNKVFSKKVKLTVATTAIIGTQPESVTTSVGKTAAFSVAAYGDGLTYQWQYSKNGGETWGNLTGETTDSYSVKAVAARNGFCYRVRVTDRAGNTVVSNLAFLVC